MPREDGSALTLSVFKPTDRTGGRKSERDGAHASAPVVAWIHGGGFAVGAPLQDFLFIDRFVAEGCTVVSPSYRLSVDVPYPAALDDCYDALLWAHAKLRDAYGNPRPIAVGGDSAGGNLCAAVCLRARDEGTALVRFMMPLYPMLDDRMTEPSARSNDAPVWNSAANEAAWRIYLDKLFGTDDVPAYAAPARATDLHGMPPCCTYVGDIEPFHDETIRFVERLRAAGVPVDFREFAGCYHGFDIVRPGSEPADEAANFLMQSFRRNFLSRVA